MLRLKNKIKMGQRKNEKKIEWVHLGSIRLFNY